LGDRGAANIRLEYLLNVVDEVLVSDLVAKFICDVKNCKKNAGVKRHSIQIKHKARRNER